MRTTFISKILCGAFLAGCLGIGVGYALSADQGVAEAAAPKNLQVFPKDTPKKQLKKAMKVIAKSLDVKCDHCHDLDDMSKDTDKKKIARSMMRMVGEINKKHFKGKRRVVCMTCHNGSIKPK